MSVARPALEVLPPQGAVLLPSVPVPARASRPPGTGSHQRFVPLCSQASPACVRRRSTTFSSAHGPPAALPVMTSVCVAGLLGLASSTAASWALPDAATANARARLVLRHGHRARVSSALSVLAARTSPLYLGSRNAPRPVGIQTVVPPASAPPMGFISGLVEMPAIICCSACDVALRSHSRRMPRTSADCACSRRSAAITAIRTRSYAGAPPVSEVGQCCPVTAFASARVRLPGPSKNVSCMRARWLNWPDLRLVADSASRLR